MADDFLSQIKAFRDKALANANEVVQEATVQITAALVARTPIDITTLRANWQFTVGEPSGEDFPDAVDESPDGSDTSTALAQDIRAVSAGRITYIVNNRVYMPHIEYGLYTDRSGGKRNSGKTVNGFSTQAPAGVRTITAIGWEEDFVKPAIAKLKI
jgi:hypothetical protein